MSTSAKQYMSVTVGDETFPPFVVNSLAAQMAWFNAAEVRGWDPNNPRGNIFAVWWSGKKQGYWDMKWEEFCNSEDVFVEPADPPADESRTSQDPTQTATPEGSSSSSPSSPASLTTSGLTATPQF